MKISVMAAGAVGCYFGAVLARAGHEVTLITRLPHAQAIGRDGLLLESAAFTGHIAVRASAAPDAIAGAQLVLFCAKSGDTQSAGAAMAPYLADDTVVLSLQNGVDNAARLSQVLGREVIPAVVYVAVGMAGPGHVRHHGRGELLLGASAHSERIARQLSAAGIPTQVSADALGALWAKLIINCAYNALSAIPQITYGELARDDGAQQVMREVVAECLAVAAAAGVSVPADVSAAVAQIAQSMAGQRSSTAQDLAAGKRSEIDYLNGSIVRLGDELGVPTPANRVLHTLVKLMERG